MRLAQLLVLVALAGSAAAQDRLFVANRSSGDVSVFAVAADGTLLLGPGSPTAVGLKAVDVAASLDGRTLVVMEQPQATSPFDQGILHVFAVAPDGALTPQGTLLLGGEPRALTIVRRGGRDFAYVSTFQQQVHAVEITGGALHVVAGSPFSAPGFLYTGDSAATPDGRFLYEVKFLGGIHGFAIGDDGALTPLVMPELAALNTMLDVAVSPDGKHLYALNDSGAVVVLGYAIGPAGLLEELAGSPFPAAASGHSPEALAFAHGGEALVVTQGPSDSVTVLQRALDGSLELLPGELKLDPDVNDVAADGDRVFVADQGCTSCPQSTEGVWSLHLQADDSLVTSQPLPAPTGGSLPVDLYLHAPAWKDQGLALGGPAGAPQLAGGGSLVGGTPGVLVLSQAPANAPVTLFVSLVGTAMPFKGGTLLAFPPALTVPLTTGATGEVTLDFVMPAGAPADLPLVVQAALKDSSAPAGIALSNALSAVTP